MTLTPAQIAVVSLVAKGRFNKEIAYLLGVEEATVKAHLSQAMKRLRLRNRVELAIWWLQRESEPLSAKAAGLPLEAPDARQVHLDGGTHRHAGQLS